MNRKLLLTGMLVAGMFVLPGLAGAAMQGVCSDCHTMHNSQNGNAMNASGNVDTPYDHLLKGSGCAGCHLQGVDNDATGRSTTGATIPNVPQVGVQTGAGYVLSGGYFDSTAADNTHHNVTDAGMTTDGALATAPGGTQASPISCTNCHTGGGHHNNAGNDSTTWLDGSTVGNSFRFLSGIQGVEDSDFGAETATDFNVYFGEARTAGNDTSGNGTISELCGRCHGNFHNDASNTISNASTGAWTRHPTDVALPADYQTNYGTTYNPAVPVGTSVVGDNFNTAFTVGNATVICLSCHVAHGNANHDMLRFSYSQNRAGDATVATGCETCHGAK